MLLRSSAEWTQPMSEKKIIEFEDLLRGSSQTEMQREKEWGTQYPKTVRQLQEV